MEIMPRGGLSFRTSLYCNSGVVEYRHLENGVCDAWGVGRRLMAMMANLGASYGTVRMTKLVLPRKPHECYSGAEMSGGWFWSRGSLQRVGGGREQWMRGVRPIHAHL
jgi:hypothetical protein